MKSPENAEAEAVVAEMAKRAEADDSRSWQAYDVVLGGNFGAVGFRACCFNRAPDVQLTKPARKSARSRSTKAGRRTIIIAYERILYRHTAIMPFRLVAESKFDIQANRC